MLKLVICGEPSLGVAITTVNIECIKNDYNVNNIAA